MCMCFWCVYYFIFSLFISILLETNLYFLFRTNDFDDFYPFDLDYSLSFNKSSFLKNISSIVRLLTKHMNSFIYYTFLPNVLSFLFSALLLRERHFNSLFRIKFQISIFAQIHIILFNVQCLYGMRLKMSSFCDGGVYLRIPMHESNNIQKSTVKNKCDSSVWRVCVCVCACLVNDSQCELGHRFCFEMIEYNLWFSWNRSFHYFVRWIFQNISILNII